MKLTSVTASRDLGRIVGAEVCKAAQLPVRDVACLASKLMR